MKIQTPIDSHIQSCLIGPFYPVGKYWNQYFPNDNLPPREDNLPYFGQITTSPSSNDKIYYLPTLSTVLDKQVWFPEPNGAYKFELEVPRYSQNEISVTIEDDGFKTLVVFGERKIGDNVSHCFTERYAFPSDNLDPENASAKVENGLLEIFFPVKAAPKTQTIKLL